MPELTADYLKAAYDNVSQTGNRLIGCLTDELKELLEKNGVALGMPIESRLKSLESTKEKVNRKQLSVSDICDVQDIVGIRLILLFREDLNKTGNIIKSNFEVVSYEDTSTRLGDTQFGYQSDHFIIRIKRDWESVPRYNGLTALCAEVQVRTMAQHIWAAASHKLQYKQEENIPQPLRRSIYRVSALLETVDLEISRLSKERREYLKSLENRTNIALDVDVVAKILAELWPARNLCPAEEDYDGLVSELRHFGLTSSDQLRNFIGIHKEEELSEEAELIDSILRRANSHNDLSERVSKGYYFTQVALTRGAIRREFGEEAASQVINCRRVAAPKTKRKTTRSSIST